MRSRILSLLLCIAAFAVTMVFAMQMLSPDADQGNRETSDRLPEEVDLDGGKVVPKQTEPATSESDPNPSNKPIPKPPKPTDVSAIKVLSEDLERVVDRLAYGADKSYEDSFVELLGRLGVYSDYLATEINDNAGSVYLKTVENILSDVLNHPFSDNKSFSTRMSAHLKSLDEKLPAQSSFGVVYPKFDTSPNGSFALAMLSVYRQQAAKPNSVTISVGGQLTVGDSKNNIASPFEFNYGAANGNYPLQGISPLFATDGLSITALSNPLTDSSEGSDHAVKGKPLYAQGLKNSGVDVSLLVGAHLNDYGQTGITDTVNAYNAVGMQAISYPQVAYVDSAVGKIAILTFDLKANLIDPVKEGIAAAKADGAKLVIVVFNRTTTDTEAIAIDGVMAQSCRAAIDNGADLVINYSQCVIQTIDDYNGRYIIYSPSVLYASTDRSKQDNSHSFIFQQTFTLENGTIKPSLLSIAPVDNGSLSDSAPKLLLDASAKAVIDDILKSSKKSKHGIGNDQKQKITAGATYICIEK